jgi:hypothetical protein
MGLIAVSWYMSLLDMWLVAAIDPFHLLELFVPSFSDLLLLAYASLA